MKISKQTVFYTFVILLITFLLASAKLNSLKPKSSNSKSTPPLQSNLPVPTIPKATPTKGKFEQHPGQDKNNVYSNDYPFPYSFKHLDGYKVVPVLDNHLRIIPSTLDENIPGEMIKGYDDPETVFVDVNYYYEYDGTGTPTNKDDVYKWFTSSVITATQCGDGEEVSEVDIAGKHFYKVYINCGPEHSYYMYFYQVENYPKYFVQFGAKEHGEQFNLVVNSFTSF